MPRMFFYGCCPPAPVGPAGPPPPPPTGDCVGPVVGTSPATVTLNLTIDGSLSVITLAAVNGYGVSSVGTTFELGCTGGSWAFFWIDNTGLRGTCLLTGTASGTDPTGGTGSGTSTDGIHPFSVSITP